MSELATSTARNLQVLCWHLDRYDRLRAATASRAGVVLSASAILFAGHTFVLSRLLGAVTIQAHRPAWVVLLGASLVTASLVVLALLLATRVLATPRGSRRMFVSGEYVPFALIFNGSDTLERVSTFAEFKTVAESQTEEEAITAALTELWVCMRQHRYRYLRLRRAVNCLRYAAMSFAVVLVAVLAMDALRP